MSEATLIEMRSQFDSFADLFRLACPDTSLDEFMYRVFFDRLTVGDSNWDEKPEAFVNKQRDLFAEEMADSEGELLTALLDEYKESDYHDSDDIGPWPGTDEYEEAREDAKAGDRA